MLLHAFIGYSPLEDQGVIFVSLEGNEAPHGIVALPWDEFCRMLKTLSADTRAYQPLVDLCRTNMQAGMAADDAMLLARRQVALTGPSILLWQDRG